MHQDLRMTGKSTCADLLPEAEGGRPGMQRGGSEKNVEDGAKGKRRRMRRPNASVLREEPVDYRV